MKVMDLAQKAQYFTIDVITDLATGAPLETWLPIRISMTIQDNNGGATCICYDWKRSLGEQIIRFHLLARGYFNCTRMRLEWER